MTDPIFTGRKSGGGSGADLSPPPQRFPLALALIFAVLAVGIIGAGYRYYRNYEKHYRAELEHQLTAIADLKTDELVQWRQERMGNGAVLFNNKSFANRVRSYYDSPEDAEAQDRLLTWLRQIQTAYRYDRVFLLDAQGALRMSFPATSEPVAPHLLEQAPEIMRAGRVTFMDFHRDETNGPIHLAILVPILDDQDGNRPLALLVLRIDPEIYLFPFIQRWPTPSPTAETLLVRRDGNEVLYLNELRFVKSAALNLRLPLDNTSVPAVSAALGQVGIMEGVDYRGVPVIADVRAVPDSPWFLVAKLDQSEVSAPLMERLREVVLLAGIMLLAAGAGLGFVWRRQDARFYQARFEAAEAMQESEQKFRTTFELAAAGITHVAPDGHFIEVNRRMCEIMGYSREELLMKTFPELTHPEDVDTDLELHRRLLADEGQNYTLEKRYLRRDRSMVWANLTISLARDPSGAPSYFISVVEDITEKKRAQEALLESNRELELRNKIANIFLTFPGEQMYTEVLKVILETFDSKYGVFGYLDDHGALCVPTMTRTVWAQCEVKDKNIVFPRETWGDSSWPRALRERKTNFTNEASKITPEGHVRIDRHVSMPIVFGGRSIGLIQLANKPTDYTPKDIEVLESWGNGIAPILGARLKAEREESQRRQTEAQLRRTLADLERSNQELEQFAYVASHDLQEPLRMVGSFVQLLQRRYQGKLEPDADEFIQYAVEGANRMKTMIQDLLTFSRVGTRGKPPEKLDANCVLGEALANLRTAIEESHAVITNEELPEILADESQLIMVFQNLIGNAIKFHGDGPPRVHVCARREDGQWVFSVRDQGIGIDPEFADRIFVIFQRLHGREEYDGTGIGLAICKKIVERHGGKIWVESKPGEGSNFYFSLPGSES